MFNSKALKKDCKGFRDCQYCEDIENRNFWHKFKFYFKSWFVYSLTDRFTKYKERISRSLAYARFGWHNYDFDMSYAYGLFEFKLKRLQECLENGHAVQEQESMDALKRIIKLIRKLRMGRYENKYYRVHDKKWGKIESETTPNYDEKGEIKHYSWNSWREKTKNASKKVKDQERRETKKIYENAEKDRQNDIQEVADLLKKHGLTFWD